MKRWRIILIRTVDVQICILHPLQGRILDKMRRQHAGWNSKRGNFIAGCSLSGTLVLAATLCCYPSFLLWLHSIPCGKLTYPMVVQSFLSYWEGLSSGAILVRGRVENWATQGQIHLMWYLNVLHIFTSPFNNDITHFQCRIQVVASLSAVPPASPA